MKMPLSTKKRCFLITGKDRRGALAATLQTLAGAGIGVTALDAATAGSSRYGALLWVNPKDYQRAARLLNAH